VERHPRGASGGLPMNTSTMDWEAEVDALVAQLRLRDADPAYALADVLHSYARISRKSSRNDEDKTIRQTYRNLREIERRGARLGEVLVDEARSAWKKDGERPAWDRLMHLVGEHEGHGVVARFVARLMRQAWDLEMLIDVAERVYGRRDGYKVVGDKREYTIGNAGDNKSLRDKVNDAQFESDEKSERIRDRNEDRLLEGDDRNGASPFGHRWESERLTISDAQLEAEREAIRDGYVRILDHADSWGDVARLWNSRGLTTRRGFRWDSQRVADVLKLPRHAGLTRKGAKVHGRQADQTSAIVSVDDYERLMVLLDGRAKGRQPAETLVVEGELAESPYFASKALRCGNCGYGMVGRPETGTYEDGSRRRGYKCPPKGCGKCGVDARAAHTWVGVAVVEILSRPEHAAMLAQRDARLKVLAERIGEYESAIAQLRAEASTIHVSRVEALADTRATIARYERELAPLLDERAQLQVAARTEATPADREALVAKWAAAGPAERRRMVKLALPNGFHCAPVGRGARLRGRDILSRFSVQRGAATPRRTDVPAT
jgi:site-specific DNA recombinase